MKCNSLPEQGETIVANCPRISNIIFMKDNSRKSLGEPLQYTARARRHIFLVNSLFT